VCDLETSRMGAPYIYIYKYIYIYLYIYDISRLRVNVLYNLILVALDNSLFLKRLIAAKEVLLPGKIRLCISLCTVLSLLISVPRYINPATPS